VSQSLLYHAFGVREGYQYVRTSYEEGCVKFVIQPRKELFVCPDCGGADVARKGRRWRLLQTVPIGLKPVLLEVEAPKCQCQKRQRRFEVSPPLCPALCQLHEILRGVCLATPGDHDHWRSG
jgi:hypothetical protein